MSALDPNGIVARIFAVLSELSDAKYIEKLGPRLFVEICSIRMTLSPNAIRELQPSESKTPIGDTTESHGLCIVIADRGLVWVGRVVTNAQWCYVDKAHTIRRWGTTKGLGELASCGPLANTALDPVDSVRVSMRALIALLPCAEERWSM